MAIKERKGRMREGKGRKGEWGGEGEGEGERDKRGLEAKTFHT
jgi:hypothetical protein